jgi:hypothetical protein
MLKLGRYLIMKKLLMFLLFSFLLFAFTPVSNAFAQQNDNAVKVNTVKLYPKKPDGTANTASTRYVTVTSTCKDGGGGYGICDVTFRAYNDTINGISTTVSFYDSIGLNAGSDDINFGVNPARSVVYGQVEEFVGGGDYYHTAIEGTVYGRYDSYYLYTVFSQEFYVK